MKNIEYTGNGSAGREADIKPTGFFIQLEKIGTYASNNLEHQKIDLTQCNFKHVELVIKKTKDKQ